MSADEIKATKDRAEGAPCAHCCEFECHCGNYVPFDDPRLYKGKPETALHLLNGKRQRKVNKHG